MARCRKKEKKKELEILSLHSLFPIVAPTTTPNEPFFLGG